MFVRTILLAVALCSVARAQPRRDAFGDPLPEGAKARIGIAPKVPVAAKWRGAVFDPTGKFLIAPVPGGALERVDLTTGKATAKLADTGTQYTGDEYLALSFDGKRGITCAKDEVAVWDATTGKVLNRAEAYPDRRGIGHLVGGCLSADGSTFAFVTVTQKGEAKQTVEVWAVGAAKRALELPLDGLEYGQPALSANGKVLAVFERAIGGGFGLGGRAKTAIRFWDATTGKKIGALDLKGSVTGFALAPDGATVALHDLSGPVVLYDPKTGRAVKKWNVEANFGNVAFAPDGKTLALSQFGTVRVWDVAADKEVSKTECPGTHAVQSLSRVQFANSTQLVAWGTDGAHPVAWEVPSGKRFTPWDAPKPAPKGGRATAPQSLAFTPDGTAMLLNGDDRTGAERWDAATGKRLGVRECAARPGQAGPLNQVTVLSGTRLVAEWQGNRYLFDAGTGKMIHDHGPAGRFDSPVLTADGELVLVPPVPKGGAPRKEGAPLKYAVSVPGAAKPRCELAVPGTVGSTAKRTPDGKRLVTAVQLLPDATRPDPKGPLQLADVKRPDPTALILWETATGKKLGTVPFPVERPEHVPFAPVGPTTAVVSVLLEPRPYLLDLVTGKVLRTFDTGKAQVAVGPVASANGKLVAFGLDDEVRVYEVGTGKLVKAFRGHTGRITALAFSPDGRLLASGAYDTTALVWELPAPK